MSREAPRGVIFQDETKRNGVKRTVAVCVSISGTWTFRKKLTHALFTINIYQTTMRHLERIDPLHRILYKYTYMYTR